MYLRKASPWDILGYESEARRGGQIFAWHTDRDYDILTLEQTVCKTRARVVSLACPRVRPAKVPPDPAARFSEGSGVIKLHTEGSLMIPTTSIYGYTYMNANIPQAMGLVMCSVLGLLVLATGVV